MAGVADRRACGGGCLRIGVLKKKAAPRGDGLYFLFSSDAAGLQIAVDAVAALAALA
jgi:hypothetical protein